MPSSGYVADTFVANEQPTTAKWNELWGNDASFNSGAGFNDTIIAARHMAANSVKSTALALSNALDATNGVQTQANAGSWGGTNYYINLGGMKFCWGSSATGSALTTGNNTGMLTVTLPTSFFSTVQTVQASVYDSGGSFENWLHCTVGAISASSVGAKVTNLGSGTSGSGYQVSWRVIGT